ncbi:mammalian cell entry protein [Mycobacterium sp. IS-1742]|uniref:MCE family protein n=1 Tax=Mycobacterium sp. IS-1742 TaxID=1772285 RepID=UPI00073FF378|nr:MCE family protein [Mycobacterium sp. IS-1742]KUI32493.1 mammalian cell entry protein [Mycobacterium sp. IS-1742]
MSILRTGRRALSVLLPVLVAGCSFQGVNSLPLPGTAGRETDAWKYRVELSNVGTLEPNSPVMVDDVVVGSVRSVGLVNRLAEVEIAVRPDVHIPANATAAVGQTSLLGSMHLQLDVPADEAPAGTLRDGATIPLDRSSTYPSTEQTLAALSAVVNAGGLGQIGDIIHSLNAAFTGRQTQIRDLLGRLDTFVGALDTQRDNVIATVTELDRFASTLADQQDVITEALRDIPPALDTLRRERPRLVAALDRLRVFSDTATGVVSAVGDNLVTDLQNLAPTIRALADVGPDISTALAWATVFPLGQDIIDRGIRGDYMNLFVTVDLTLGRFKRGLLAGTSFGDENAPLVPAPGDPGYDSFYSKNPLGEAVAPPPGVKGPDRMPPPPTPAPPTTGPGGG